MELDMREFNKAAEEVIKESERTYPQWINSRLLFVAIKAIKFTQKAISDQIAIELGQIGTRLVVDRKTGKLKKGRRMWGKTNEYSFAANIVNARRRKAGLIGIWGHDLQNAAKAMISARLRSAGFIRSGWTYAIKTLLPIVKKDEGQIPQLETDTVRMTGQAKGWAKPAERVWNSQAWGEIVNTALLDQAERIKLRSSHASNPMPIAVAGLQRAINSETIEMLKHLQEKLQPVFDRHSAR